MSHITLPELSELLRQGAGEGSTLQLTESDIDTPLTHFDVDSLAMLELVARLEKRYGLRLPDDAPASMATLSAALRYLNREILAQRAEAS
ncbi:MAG: acyl carrier protein [Propionibacteriales bacterium]|nr:acyl carrier protein [Propionibacteriales bacterium]